MQYPKGIGYDQIYCISKPRNRSNPGLGRKNGTAEKGRNLKSDEVHRLAQELAQLTGEGMTSAVTEAVRQRLERVRKERGGDLASRLIAIGKDCAARLKEPVRSIDHGDLLYGADGLPR